MSKLGLASVSLIAAIPGGILTVLLVMTFLKNSENLSIMLWVISVPTLLTSVLVAVLPGGVMLFGPKAETSDEDEAGKVADEDELLADGGKDEELDDFDDDSEVVAQEGDELSTEADDDELDAEFDDDANETVDGASEDVFMEDDDDFGLELDEDDK